MSEDKRIKKAEEIIKKGEYEKINDYTYKIRGYEVTAGSCTCIDRKIRQVNCKHILAMQILMQKNMESVNYMRLEDPISFEKKYGINTLMYLKGTNEVIEERGRLIWL